MSSLICLNQYKKETDLIYPNIDSATLQAVHCTGFCF